MASSGISNLLDISRRSLANQSQSIRVIGNNIANVNTPGYTRRSAEITSTKSADGTSQDNNFGLGADVNRVVRTVDQFLNKELLQKTTDRAHSELRDEFLARVETFFPIDGSAGAIGDELTQFFTALENLAESPADLALREALVQQGASLTRVINKTFNGLAELQREADGQLNPLIIEVNELSANIAALNGRIQNSESSVQDNLTLRDQRDQALRDLSELVSFNSVEQSDGTVLVSLSNGFTMVQGARSQAMSVVPSSQTSSTLEGLDGANLSSVVFNFGSGGHFDLTDVVAAGGGRLGGLLSLRGSNTSASNAFDHSGDIVELAARVELLARDLFINFNREYLGPDANSATAAWEASSTLLQPDAGGNGVAPSGVFALFSTIDGVVTDAGGSDSGIADAGDLSGASSIARVLSFAVQQPEDFAAGRDLDPADGPLEYPGQGSAANLHALLALRDETMADRFARLEDLTPVGQMFTTPADLPATLEEFYEATVGRVGSIKGAAERVLTLNEQREKQIEEFQSSVSGVSLDEEFAKLIEFQRSFEASARMIRIGDELLQEIINVLG